MKVIFDPAFDSGYWPGPLDGRTAVAGEIWVGPSGLLSLLETATGCSGPVIGAVDRVVSLLDPVRLTAGFWSDSAAVDPLATVRELLRWRDLLTLSGWTGGVAEGRLADLERVTADVLPGLPERLRSVMAGLDHGKLPIETLVLHEPTDDLPALWQSLFQKIEAGGTRVERKVIEGRPGKTDLRRALRPDFQPVGDGSLRMLRAQGPLQAAEEIAAWLAHHVGDRSTAIIGADEVLDEALVRFGLPPTGSGGDLPETASLQLLPLVLQMLWDPPDPARVLQLLMSPVSPLPRDLSLRLARTLQEWPAVGNSKWLRVLAEWEEGRVGPGAEETERRRREREEEGIEAGAGERAGADARQEDDQGDGTVARVRRLLQRGCSRSERSSKEEILDRVSTLEEWLRARLHLKHGNGGAPWSDTLQHCGVFRNLVEGVGLEGFDEPALSRLIAEAARDVQLSPRRSACAGLYTVGRPDSIVGPISRVVWWRFVRGSAPSPPRIPFTTAECRALADAGVRLPDPGATAVRAAERWQRPVMLTEEALLLVCPRFDVDGEEAHPHPLWDEMTANVRKVNRGRLATALVVEEIPAEDSLPRESRSARPLPAPRRDWQLDRDLTGDLVRLSPSQIATLLSCPFRWLLTYATPLDETAPALPADPMIRGSLAHHFIGQVMKEGLKDSEQAVRSAATRFDQEAPFCMAALFLPGWDNERERIRQTIIDSVKELTRLLNLWGAVMDGVEVDLEGPIVGIPMIGRADLLVRSPDVVIDIKYSGMTRRRQELEGGTALQLACYAFLAQQVRGGSLPAVGYFILDHQQLLTPDTGLKHGFRVQGPSMENTWEGMRHSLQTRLAQLQVGTVEAPGNPGEGIEPPKKDGRDEGGSLVLKPPCDWCEFDLFCGMSPDGEKP